MIIIMMMNTQPDCHFQKQQTSLTRARICPSSLPPDSDQYSDMTDSDADRKRRGLRRGQLQQVNYRETSESSDNSRSSARKEAKPHGRPRKENLSSDYSDGE